MARSVDRAKDKRKELQQDISQKEEEIRKLQQELLEAADKNLFQRLGDWLLGSSGEANSGTSPNFKASSAIKP